VTVSLNRVLVTGATGLIGTRVCRTLRANGIAVSALAVDRTAAAADAGADRTFAGDAGDVDLVRAAMRDVDAVVHLAALASPEHGSAVDVFAGNTRATFVVLDEAGSAGVRRAVIASSYSILGLTFAPHVLHPPYFPIDDGTPLQVEDPYSLSKQVDEATARMVGRRYGIDVVALRFPYIANEERLVTRLRDTVAAPGIAATESWAYLDVRDAAEAAWLALTAPVSGVHSVFVAAPEILAPFPTEDLIRTYHPDAEIRGPLPGRTTPIDLAPATRLLGFAARHTVELDPLPLPES
jgi:nucleoside-diphosphate-sugar epimerase